MESYSLIDPRGGDCAGVRLGVHGLPSAAFADRRLSFGGGGRRTFHPGQYAQIVQGWVVSNGKCRSTDIAAIEPRMVQFAAAGFRQV